MALPSFQQQEGLLADKLHQISEVKDNRVKDTNNQNNYYLLNFSLFSQLIMMLNFVIYSSQNLCHCEPVYKLSRKYKIFM